MTRYHFHIRHRDGLTKDIDGAEFADLEQARLEAIRSAREIIAERVKRGDIVNGDVFEITTSDGEIADRLSFRSTMRLE
ncbi:DUF6894 family protein [Neorhizobium sp. NPDC001467]|uniref:DUF6894 family protein n=1 Tax=Neorhizobium sp. NPDC001467 TaxID=3390595 RepID=UPI003D080F8E